jgi:hypothetical protein
MDSKVFQVSRVKEDGLDLKELRELQVHRSLLKEALLTLPRYLVLKIQ